LARYVLDRITDDKDSIEKIAENFEDDKNFISGIIGFLIDIHWLKQDENGVYRKTRKGKTYTIKRERPILSFNIPP
jgi:hypothetical protein